MAVKRILTKKARDKKNFAKTSLDYSKQEAYH